MELTVANVERIFNECVFSQLPKEGDRYILAEGIVRNVVFNPLVVEKYSVKIKELLDNLDSKYNQDNGGGYSFLAVCLDCKGRQWGEQSDGEKLLQLGLASGWIDYCLPRDVWSALPGGVPYFVVRNNRRKVGKKLVK